MENVISGNSASGYGGGVAIDNGAFIEDHLENNVISGNSSCYGGGIAIRTWYFGTDAEVVGNSIVHNFAVEGGGIYVVEGSPKIVNNIIAFARGGGGVSTGASSPSLSYCDLWGNVGGNYVGLSDLTGISGNISVDPLFVNSSSGDFHLKSRGGRWTGTTWAIDSVHSPCIDAGDPASSCWYEPLPNGGRVNMGAFGDTYEASKSMCRLTIEYAGAGTVRVNGVLRTLPYSASFAPGSAVSVDAIPNPDWQFQVWSGDVPAANKTADPLVLTMNQDRTIKPWFQKPQHQLTIEYAGAGTVSVNGTRRTLPYSGSFPVGSAVTVDAVPSATWQFQVWSGDLPAAQKTADPLVLTMDQDRTIKPWFQRIKRQLTIEYAAAGTAIVNGTTRSLPYTGSFPINSTVKVDALPIAKWEFQVWSGEVPTAQKTADPLTLIMDQNRVIKPNFQRIKHTLTIGWAAAGKARVNGVLQTLPYTGRFLPGAVVAVQAVPKAGYLFDQWSGDYPTGGRFAAAISVTMVRDRSLRAYFKSGGVTSAQLTSINAVPTAGGAELCFTLSAPAMVSAEVLNISGRTVKHIVTGRLCDSGPQSLAWNGYSDLGTRVPHGSYLVRVSAFTPEGGRCESLTPLQMR